MAGNGDPPRPEGPNGPPEELPSLSLEDLVSEPLDPDCLAGLPGDRYTAISRLGEGTFGEVIRAHDRALDRDVAVKRIRIEAFSARGQLDEVKARFVREARVAAGLRHPNIVTTHDIVSTPRSNLIVMELVEGRDLASFLGERGRLDLDETLEVLDQVAAALDHAHEAGVVHRDIKPANIMVEPSGRVKVMDFGIAKVEQGGHLTSTGLIMGTPDYMSPEQARGGQVDARADVFSLGCVLYECLSGAKPFHDDSVTAILLKVVTEPPPPIDLEALALPPALEGVFRRALAKEPGRRFASAGELVAAARQASHGIEPAPPSAESTGTVVTTPPVAVSGAPAAAPASPGDSTGPQQVAGLHRRIPASLALLALVLVAGGVAGVVAVRTPRPTPVTPADALVVEEVPGFFGRLLGREARLHITVPGETTLSVEMETAVSSATSRPGEAVSAQLVEPIVIEGHEAIARGARVRGRLTRSESAAAAGGRGRLVLSFDALIPTDGPRVPIASESVEVVAPPPRPTRSRKKGLAGAWGKVTSTVEDLVREVKGETGGRVAGTRAVQGGGGVDIELPAGSTLDVALERAVTVSRARDR